MDTIFSRVSVRQFTNKPVNEDQMERILRAAMQSPSAGNQQPWKFVVVTNPEVLESLSKTNLYSGFVKDAPCAIVIVGDMEVVKYEGYIDIDCAIASENIMLEAHQLGLGSCMIGVAPEEKNMNHVSEVLSLGTKHRPFTIIAVGHPLNASEVKSRFDIKKISYIK